MWNYVPFAVLLFLTIDSIAFDIKQDEIDRLCMGREIQRIDLPSNCTHFIQCAYDTGLIESCPQSPNNCFDAPTQRCVIEDKCSCQPTTDLDHYVSELCKEMTDSWNIQVPAKDCSSFYMCLGPDLEPQFITCPPGLHYSRSLKICVPPVKADCQPLATMCEAKHKFAALECWQYYECSARNEEPILKSCHSDEYFNVATSNCDIDTNGICGNHSINNPTTVPTTISTTVSTTTVATPIVAPMCTTNTEGFMYPHQQCYKFYWCLNQRPVEVHCGDGNYYMAASGSCKKDITHSCQY